MTNGQKMRKLFEEKSSSLPPGCHDALTAKIISYLGFDAVYMTGYGQSASHLGQPDVGLMTMSEMVMRASNTVEAAGTFRRRRRRHRLRQRCQRAAHHPRV